MNESKKFMALESLSAKILLSATILAICLSNSPLRNYYNDLFHTSILGHKFNLLFFINDGLMTIFFLVVGLEIKYEMVRGTLNTWSKAALPGIGAIGGMIIPAVIYALINYHDSIMLRGWAIPTATDIAFSLAVLSLLKSRISPALKIFLTALAIFDDLAAIIIIAIFYTNQISLTFLLMVFICLFILLCFNKRGITKITPYLIVGCALWSCLLKAGIHPTLAGVSVALMLPVQNREKTNYPLQKLQHSLHPWVALGILPLFAFANAGVSLLTLGLENLQITLILGVLFGLFLGKQLGIFSICWLAVKLGIATLPEKINWRELYAVGIICGVGFTISLFIGSLAFNDMAENYLDSIKLGVLFGSLLSGIIGYCYCLCITNNKNQRQT